MCSRSRQYQIFEYHQKSLSQKWSYGLSKYDFLNLAQIWVGANSELVCYSLTPSQFENFLKIFTLVPPKPESPHVLRLGMYASGLQGVTKLRIFWKFSIWEALWRGGTRLKIFWFFFELVFKKEFKSPLAPGNRQPRHQIATWRPSGLLKGGSGGRQPPSGKQK